ncbi:MAG: hypothetical protein HF978_04630 [Desulfobacteraceae bacterium]|nr:hypothetical protein [Desulfobacteraceae bacterium]MBC2754815.1 hypothetical protein [Desulfobacteraceae bacterium]
MYTKLFSSINSRFKNSKIYNLHAFAELKHERKRKNNVQYNKFHIQEALDWIKRAQDATPDNGVSRGYSVGWNSHFQSKGWQASYPETTGYIIPTFIDCGKYFNDKELINRAIKMAEWEIDVQMKSGAVIGGVINEGKPTPAVFCTGMVIFGLVRAFQETQNVSFLNAAEKAASFLLTVQNKDGVFVESKHYNFANKISNTYHTRVAWALIALGKLTNNENYIKSGIKNIEYRLKFQEKNGWFRDNCLSDPENPLVHTICYALRGILEAGFLLNDDRYLAAVRLAADHILLEIDEEGYLGGCLNKNWQSSVKWCCLTGNAQLAIILLKLFRHTNQNEYLTKARTLITFLKTTQNCTASDHALRGGIKGSYPFNGVYGRFQILNWATKFFIDAMLLEEQINDTQGPAVGTCE